MSLLAVVLLLLLGLGTFQLFIAVSLTVSSDNQVDVSLKGNNGMFVSLTAFPFFFKLALVKNLNFIIGVNGRYSAVNGGYLQLTT